MGRDVVVCFLRYGTEVLLLRGQRGSSSERVEASDDGRWNGVLMPLDGNPKEAATTVIEEILDPATAFTVVKQGDPLELDGADGQSRQLHPFLVDCESRSVRSRSDTDYEWLQPPELVGRRTVPRLWEAYRAVGPSVSTVRDDAEHGSAYISLRALEVLRDRATTLSDADRGRRLSEIESVAEALLAARPSMAVVRNRINRVMATAGETTASIRDCAMTACREAVEADSNAAERAVAVTGDRVFTLSRSGTVVEAIETRAPDAVFVAESRPGGEGIEVAESLASTASDVTVLADAAVGDLIATRNVDTVLVGADSVLADGSVVNKVGTRHAARAAADAEVPCYAVCSRDKITPKESLDLDTDAAPAVYTGEYELAEYNPLFERVPARLFSGIVTEAGVLALDDIKAVAAEHAAAAEWREK